MTAMRGRIVTSLRAARLPLRLATIAAVVRKLGGWRRWLAAWAAGTLSALAMAPFFLAPVLFLTLPVLLWLIEGAAATASDNARRAALRTWWAAAMVGWWFGFGFHLAGLYWVGAAFLVEADRFALLMPFAVTLLPAGLALFHALAAGCAALLGGVGLRRVLALAVALAATEWLRGHVLTGFPWNLLGYALTYPDALMQSAAVLGVYGLTLFAVIVFSSPLVALAEASPQQAQATPRWLLALGPALVPLVAAWLYGTARLAETEPPAVSGVRLRIVQPSIPQHEKWRQEKQREFFLAHLDLSTTRPDGRRLGLDGISHVIWPEAAMPFLPLDHPEALAAIGELLPSGTTLIAGALRLEGSRAFNSLIAFDDEGRVLSLYDKIHLVPFGEYLPFQETLERMGLEQIARRRGGFSSGTSPRPLVTVPGLPPIAALICYEAVFPSAVIQGADRPHLLVNLTNDGWFGDTTGPYQHFHQARVRAVEEGLPLIRAANNGISAVVDARGRVLARLGIDARGVIDAGLPAAWAAPPYARFGDTIFLLCWLAALTILCFRRR
ncbi:MAG TPA: apolipoprotein N-acyltransferase [Hyphomicrobiaceae bacterium]|nr:apolipoprotein N-acyltransferase [Hyphomicrobiaceae bacterium]